MLILPERELKRQHEDAKRGLTDEFNRQMENILNKNQSVDKYWILGKVKFPDEFQGKVGRVFLDACAEKPPLVKEAFLYEVDNRKGEKTLLWLVHPDNTLELPTIGKKVKLPGGKKKGRN